MTPSRKFSTKGNKKEFTHFRIKVRSRHSTHDPIREKLPKLRFRSIVRLGSTTEAPPTGPHVECNTIEAIGNSANKKRMKTCFTKGGVKTAKWYLPANMQEAPYPFAEVIGVGEDGQTIRKISEMSDEVFPIVAKSLTGSRGRGNYLLNTRADYDRWVQGKDLNNYIFEKFYDYVREYRLHVTKNGCFYTNRKMLKKDTPEDKRWFRNDSNCTWILETNEQFDKPTNWKDIEAECVKALQAVGLDIGACDVKVQGATDKKGKTRTTPDFIVIEINSAPSFGEGTEQRYLVELPRILQQKKLAQTTTVL